MIKAVLFDIGGTLVKTVEIPEIYRRILETQGVIVSRDQIKEAHEANEDRAGSYIDDQLEMGPQYWYEWNKQVMKSLGFAERSKYLGMIIADYWWEYADLELYPDVMTTIQALRARDIKVGVLTNGFKYDYIAILEKLGLSKTFDVVVGPDSCGYGKPDKRIFMYALDMLGLDPSEVLYIGNDYKYDYLGASNAGLQPLLVGRDREFPDDVPVITRLEQVLDYI